MLKNNPLKLDLVVQSVQIRQSTTVILEIHITLTTTVEQVRPVRLRRFRLDWFRVLLDRMGADRYGFHPRSAD